jgi:cystathionine beta-lyase
MSSEARQETRLLHVGTTPNRLARTVGPPVQRGSTILMPDAVSLYDDTQITYGRAGLAAHDVLMEALGILENAAAVRLFPSGLAAMTGALLAVLKTGDEVLVTDAIYKPTRRFCDRVLRRFGVSVRYYPPEISAEALIALCTPATRLLVLESPGSLTLEVQDTSRIAALARGQGVLTMMDNTWAAGLYFKPLDHGVDISVQALTKYVGGHSDVFMGSAAVADPALVAAMDEAILDFGWAVSGDDAYLMLRGLRTLPTRLARHQLGGLRVATWLSAHPRVAMVRHPALEGCPGHAFWRRDFTGAAGLFAFALAPAGDRATSTFLDSLRLFGLGFSWGGFESLAVNCDPQFSIRQFRPALSGPLIRLSVGLEDPDDLIADLDRALAAIQPPN